MGKVILRTSSPRRKHLHLLSERISCPIDGKDSSGHLMASDTCGQDTANSPTAVTKWILAGHKGPTGEAALQRSLLQTKPRGSCLGCFTLSTSLHYIGVFLSKGRASLVILMTSAMPVPVQMTWEDCCSSKPHAGLLLQGESQSSDPEIRKTSSKSSLLCLPVLFALDQSQALVKEILCQSLRLEHLSTTTIFVSQGKGLIFDEGTTCEYRGF